MLIIESLLERDCLGEYFRHKITLKECCDKISILAKKCNLNVFEFFQLFMIYYQCDIAPYTKDVRGFRFLEHLFEYEDGKKIFDKNEKLLKFSVKYQKMYFMLN